MVQKTVFSYEDAVAAFDLLDRDHKGYVVLGDLELAAVGIENLPEADRVQNAFAELTKASGFSSRVNCDSFTAFLAQLGLAPPRES